MRKFVKYIFLLVNLVAILLLMASYFSPGIDPSVFWWPSLLGLTYPYLIILNIAFMVFWLLLSWKYLFLSLLCIVAGFNVHKTYFQFSGISTEADKNDGIKVVSYNVRSFYSYLETEDKTNTILDFIASQNANIICLQETKLQRSGDLNPLKLKAHFPGIIHCQLAHQSSWNGPVTFTSFPIVEMGEIRFDDSSNMVIYTDIKTPDDTIRIYNCHLQSYGIRTEDYSIIDTLGFQDEKIEELKHIGGKLKNAFVRRAKQVRELKDHMNACPYPLIVCGDFNDTPVSFTYNMLITNLKDSFVQSGQGVSNTYRGKLPSFRIDYILYSEDFSSADYQRHKVEYSDHYPVTTRLFRE